MERLPTRPAFGGPWPPRRDSDCRAAPGGQGRPEAGSAPRADATGPTKMLPSTQARFGTRPSPAPEARVSGGGVGRPCPGTSFLARVHPAARRSTSGTARSRGSDAPGTGRRSVFNATSPTRACRVFTICSRGRRRDGRVRAFWISQVAGGTAWGLPRRGARRQRRCRPDAARPPPAFGVDSSGARPLNESGAETTTRRRRGRRRWFVSVLNSGGARAYTRCARSAPPPRDRPTMTATSFWVGARPVCRGDHRLPGQTRPVGGGPQESDARHRRTVDPAEAALFRRERPDGEHGRRGCCAGLGGVSVNNRRGPRFRVFALCARGLRGKAPEHPTPTSSRPDDAEPEPSRRLMPGEPAGRSSAFLGRRQARRDTRTGRDRRATAATTRSGSRRQRHRSAGAEGRRRDLPRNAGNDTIDGGNGNDRLYGGSRRRCSLHWQRPRPPEQKNARATTSSTAGPATTGSSAAPATRSKAVPARTW